MAKQKATLFDSSSLAKIQSMAKGAGTEETGRTTRLIPLDKIDDSEFNVGMPMDNIQDLADSIRQYGLLEPVILYDKQDGRYELNSGHRRCRAMRFIGGTEIEAIVKPMPKNPIIKFREHTDANTQNREKDTRFWLSRVKVARTVLAQTGFHGTKDEEVGQIADMLGKGASKSQIYHLDAYDQMDPALQALEESGLVSVHTLYSAVKLSPAKQKEVAKRALALAKKDHSEEPKITKAQFDGIVQEVKQEQSKKQASSPSQKDGAPVTAKAPVEKKRKNRAGYGERLERDSLKLIGEMNKAHSAEEKSQLKSVIAMLEKSLKELKERMNLHSHAVQ